MSGETRADGSIRPVDPDPTVSVVITTYQHARYLDDALNSVLSQHVPSLQVVVVDDGSTDHPERVAARFPGVQLIRQDNRGLAAARNTGLAHCTGEYVVFLDADDLLTAGGLRVALAAAAAHPGAALVYGAHVRSGADGRSITDTVYVPAQPEDSYRQFLRGNPIGMHAAALLRRAAVVEVGGFDEALPACEDYDLYLRIAARYEVRSHPAVVATYRIHGANMSADAGFMLHAVLRTLARQRPLVRHDRRLRRALREGAGVWLRYYGLRYHDEGGPKASMVRAGLSAIRLFPGAVAGLVGHRSLRLGRRAAKSFARGGARPLLPAPVHRRVWGSPPVGPDIPAELLSTRPALVPQEPEPAGRGDQGDITEDAEGRGPGFPTGDEH